jgi:predicted permease
MMIMLLLMACGAIWQITSPNGLSGDNSRAVLTTLVYYLFLPALVLDIIWQTPLNIDSLKISAVASFGVLLTLAAAWLVYHVGLKQPGKQAGALLLASAFPNVTYFGLPVLEASFGPEARSIAIQYDLFACAPLLFSVGILLARHYGESQQAENPLSGLFKIPALWAMFIAAGLSFYSVPKPDLVEQALTTLGNGVVPLMLISLGMSLRWACLSWRNLLLIMPLALLQLVFQPFFVWLAGIQLNMQGDLLTAVTLEAGMPTMVLGIMLCDRYRLNAGLYAAAVTATTLLSLLSLPLWYQWAG